MLVNFDSLKTVMNGIKTYIDGSTIKDWNENNPNSIKYIKNKPFYNYTSNKDLLSF